MKLYNKASSLLLASIIAASTSCTTNPYTGEQEVSKAAIYGTGGAAAGALTGLLTGGNTKSVLIGAAAGGAVGGGYGYYRDTQEKKLREVLQGTGVQIKKEGNNIRLVMPGNITFPTGGYDIKSSFFQTLNSVALVLKEYNKTTVLVGGHTDSDGSESKNLTLSQNRAESVANYLISQGINSARVSSNGYGSSQPTASNSDAGGKTQNRRVEISLIPIQ